MQLFSVFAVTCVIASSALAALQPRASPVCNLVCNPTPPSTAPGGQYIGQSNSGPDIECEYFTTEFHGSGSFFYACLYTTSGVSFYDDPAYCPETLIDNCSSRKRRGVGAVPKRQVQSGKTDAPAAPVIMARFGKRS